MKRKFLCFSLVLGMAFSGITVSAGDIHSLLPDKAHEAAGIREVSGGNTAQTKKYYEIVPFFFQTCTACGEMCNTVCAMEGVVGDVYTHDTLLTKDCQVTILRSRGATICSSCGNVNETYGYHDCWEVHTKCSKGQYDVCPMEIS